MTAKQTAYASIHPYDYVTVYQQAEPGCCSVEVSEDEVAADLFSFLKTNSDLKPHSVGNVGEETKRFSVECTSGELKFHIRKWATAWRKVREHVYPPIDVVRIRGKAGADIDQLFGRRVNAHLFSGEVITGKIISFQSGYETWPRLCVVLIMVSESDRTLDRFLEFHEVDDFEIIA